MYGGEWIGRLDVQYESQHGDVRRVFIEGLVSDAVKRGATDEELRGLAAHVYEVVRLRRRTDQALAAHALRVAGKEDP